MKVENAFSCKDCGKQGTEEEIEQHGKIGLFPRGSWINFDIVFKVDNPVVNHVRKARVGIITNVVLNPGLVLYTNEPQFRKLFYEVSIKAELKGDITIYVPEKNIQLAERKWGQACMCDGFISFVKKEFPDFIIGQLFNHVSLEETPI